jgi:hypothetical protein
MKAGYVQRAIQLNAAVKECARIGRPVICWPEDIGHMTPADLPFIDLEIAKKEFVAEDTNWCYSDEPLCLPTPGKAYAVVEEIEDTGGTKMHVVTFRPKTLDECKCDEDRVHGLRKLMLLQDDLIVHLGFLIGAIAETFIEPDISWEDHPEINDLLDMCDERNTGVNDQWEKVRDERDAGTTE